jgi:hypothetical protein
VKFISGFVLFLMATGNAFGYMADYIPLTKQELNKPFKLVKDLTLDGNFYGKTTGKPYILQAGANSITIEAAEDRPCFTFSGAGLRGKAWKILLGNFGQGAYMYLGDLDKNGFDDIAIISWTGGCGMSPNIHILTFMFDQGRLPVPFACDGYGDATESSIDDIWDMDGDGKAVLLHMTFGNGYWVTSLYKAGNALWSRVNGVKFGKEFPCYTRYSFKPNNKPTKLKQGKQLYAPDFSNDKPRFSGVISSFEMADIEESQPVKMKITGDKGGIHECSPRSWYATCNLVIDTKDERKIVNYMAGHDAVKDAFDEIYKGKYMVEIFGGRSGQSCEPELIWAHEK